MHDLCGTQYRDRNERGAPWLGITHLVGTVVLYHPAIARPTTHLCATLLCVLALTGCGGDGSAATSTRTTAGAPLPTLATRAPAPGEIVLRGEASPQTRGPFTFSGRYLVRFEQYAPENAKLDFRTQTPFRAALVRREGDPVGQVELVEDAARGGRRELAINGRYFVDVSFGDFPYVVRFTPRDG